MDEVPVAYSLSEIIESGYLLLNHRLYIHHRKEVCKTNSTPQFFGFNVAIYLLFKTLLSIWAATTNYHRLGDLQTTDIYFSQIWTLEVLDQSTSKFGVW